MRSVIIFGTLLIFLSMTSNVQAYTDISVQDAKTKIDNNEVFILDVRTQSEYDDIEIIPGWEVPIIDYFTEPGRKSEYEYDFGDSWYHEILFEGILLKNKGEKYPMCLAGERACPPEDFGSVDGYYRVVKILHDPKHDEYVEYIEWLKGHAKNYHPYKTDEFNPDNVRFDNPKLRWNNAFSRD